MKKPMQKNFLDKIVFSIMDWLTSGALTERNKLCDAINQLRTQLGGCSVAANGGTSECLLAHKGSYGWSPAYQDVLDLRLAHDKLLEKSANLERANSKLITENNRLTIELQSLSGRSEVEQRRRTEGLSGAQMGLTTTPAKKNC